MEKEIITYKLIKEYPGSPSLGCTVSKSKNNTINKTTSNDTIWLWYGDEINNPKLFPEFWQPVYKQEPQFKEGEWLYHYDPIFKSKLLFRYKENGSDLHNTNEYYHLNEVNDIIGSGECYDLLHKIEKITRASPEQIEKVLTIVAKQKGFVEGARVKYKSSDYINTIPNENFYYIEIHEQLYFSGGYPIYGKTINGFQWATIIEKPTELVKSWEDAFDGNGCYISDNSNMATLVNSLRPTHPFHKNVFKLEAQAKSALAFAQLSHIVADANGDWVADWGNLNQDKHVIFSNLKYELETAKCCLVPVFLPMKSQEIAIACLEKHRTLWEDFWMINK